MPPDLLFWEERELPKLLTASSLECFKDPLGPQWQSKGPVPTTSSTFQPLVPFSKPEGEEEPRKRQQDDSCISATLVPKQDPQLPAAE